MAHLLAEALLEEGWGWREFGIPLSLWVRDQILHRLIPAWRGWDPHLHEVPEEDEEDEGTQREVPSWDGGFAEVEHRVVLERAARVLGEEAARALKALAEEVPEHPFAGRVRLGEYVRWYFGN